MMLEIVGLHKDFGGIKAVNNCHFSVEEGKIVALIGPNGAGKTTVFNLISGFSAPDAGKIKLKGKEVTQLLPYKRAMAGIARTFQLMRLFPKMTVMENMLLGIRECKEGLLHALWKTKSMKEEEKRNEEKALELLKFVGLEGKVNECAENLSYGQQKLLEIARALASDPKVLMLDEPAAGVNPTMLKKIGELLVKLKKEKGMTILFIEHDMEFVMHIADKVIVLDYGKEIAIGTPQEIKKNEKVIDAYLGVTK